ncbi:MAG: deoxyribose-phosphate aldolase [Spirochaetes bacterium]|nr:deoxyribose-phosphate aldolase [Spirochaetota bacterium]
MCFKNINEITKLIDHTLLKPEAAQEDIKTICDEALKYEFYSVCVNPWWVKIVKQRLKESKVKVCTVIGFPLGMTNIKAEEAKKAIYDGADELDMVIAIGALKSELYNDVKKDIEQVVKLGKPVKVILETCLLNEEQIRLACRLSIEAKASFVKTSTGFSKEGAKENLVKIMRQEVKELLGVKASGGIRDLQKLIAMIKAGANRVGTSNSIKIIEEFIKSLRKH